jgi:hypothetical protein
MAVANHPPLRNRSRLQRFSSLFFPCRGTTISKAQQDDSNHEQGARKPPPELLREVSPNLAPPGPPPPASAGAAPLLPPLKISKILRKSQSSNSLLARARPTSPATSAFPGHGRVVSSAVDSRPAASYLGADTFDNLVKKRRSWMPGSRSASRHASRDFDPPKNAVAWVDTGKDKLDYSLGFLQNGERVMIPASCPCGCDADLPSGTRTLG